MESTVQFVPPAPPAEPLSARLLRSRKWAQLRQVDIAKKVGVSHRTVWAWEHGEKVPGFDKMILWAKETGFDLAWFAEGVDFDAGVTAGITQRSLLSPNGRGQPPLRRADVSHGIRSRRPFGPSVCAGSPGAIHR